jgi:hypothetical protein
MDYVTFRSVGFRWCHPERGEIQNVAGDAGALGASRGVSA